MVGLWVVHLWEVRLVVKYKKMVRRSWKDRLEPRLTRWATWRSAGWWTTRS